MINLTYMRALTARVIVASRRSPSCFYAGIVFRICGRLFDLLPFFIGYLCLSGLWRSAAVAEAPRLQALDSLPLLITALIATLIGQLIFNYLGQRMTFLGSYNLMEGYREQAIDNLHRMPLGQLQSQRVGQLSEVMTEDVKRLEGIFTHLIADIVSALAASLILACALFLLNWQITLGIQITFPFALWALGAAKRFFIEQSKHKQSLFSEASGLLVEFIMGLKTLRLFNRSELWLNRLNRHFSEIKRLSFGVETWGGGSVMLYRLILEFGLVGLLLAVGLLADEEQRGAQVWLFYFLLIYKLYQPLLEIGETAAVLNYAAQSEIRLRQIIEAPLLLEPDTPQTPKTFSIAFNHVSFSYEQQLVIQDISFFAPQGTLTAIVGPSGSGKSTLLNLLARFYDPSQGTIEVGGIDIKAIGSDLLYQSMSMVFQNVQLNQGSILDNIAMGKCDADFVEIERACHDAYCVDFIEQLPDKYQTKIGESGVGLSGGERQRLSIARALLKDAPIMLLDEATASVDPIAQFEIQRALSRLAKGRTVIMIAHRLNTIRYADQIIVLDKGRISGCGKHEQLLAENPLYKKLWRAQNT